MKSQQKKPAFTPITLIIETQTEFDVLLSAIATARIRPIKEHSGNYLSEERIDEVLNKTTNCLNNPVPIS